MPDIPAAHDFQTVFQILATFEGFSTWKGTKAFKAGEFTDIGKPFSFAFDEIAFSRLCEQLKGGKKRKRTTFRILGFLVGYLLKAFAHWCRWLFDKTIWDAVRFLHRTLVFLLKSTPIVSVPLLSLSYLAQRGCLGTCFAYSHVVFWFIVIKTSCYMACFLLATMLMHHIRVTPPMADTAKIVSP